MDLKLAKTLLDEQAKTISLKKLEDSVEKEGQSFFYFDKENSKKNLNSLVEHFEKKGLSVYYREVRYGLDSGDYIYEVHIFWVKSFLYKRLAVLWM